MIIKIKRKKNKTKLDQWGLKTCHKCQFCKGGINCHSYNHLLSYKFFLKKKKNNEVENDTSFYNWLQLQAW